MALTVALKTPNALPAVAGNIYLAAGTILFDSSYPTGGEALTATDLKFPGHVTIHSLICHQAGGFAFEYDHTNGKLKVLAPVKKYTAAMNPASMATDGVSSLAVTVTGVASTDVCLQVQAAAALEAGLVVQSARVTSADTITVELSNTSAGTVDGASANADFYVVKANGAMVEIPDTTDISAVTTRFTAIACPAA